MTPRGIAAALAVLALTASACGDDGGDDARSADGAGSGALDTPTFAEDEPAITRSSDTVVSASTTAPSGGATTSPTAAMRRDSVSFDDPIGDATPGVGSPDAPPWTDLAGASLERQGNAFRLTIRLGGDAPTTSPGPETMNIASFYDIDGDNAVDYELWINLGREGWGPVWYDDQGNAATGDDTNVTVVVDGDEVRLLFPDVMLDEPDRLRFSIASEYGELSTIGSPAARRDDAPDDDRAASFP